MIKIGFVGLGDIGAPMAARCVQAGFPVTLWARRDASYGQFVPGTYNRAASPEDLGRRCDVVGVAVFDEDDVREVVTGVAGGMAAGGIVLVHSTVSVEFVRQLAKECEPAGITVMDVPVSGLHARAVTGELTIMAGGPVAAYETVLPMLRAMGSHVRHHGDLGSGLRMKALNQLLLVANMATACLALEAGERLGLDRATAAETMLASTGASTGLHLISGRMTDDHDFRDLAARIAAKDLSAFDTLGVPSDLRAIAGEAFALIDRLR